MLDRLFTQVVSNKFLEDTHLVDTQQEQLDTQQEQLDTQQEQLDTQQEQLAIPLELLGDIQLELLEILDIMELLLHIPLDTQQDKPNMFQV